MEPELDKLNPTDAATALAFLHALGRRGISVEESVMVDVVREVHGADRAPVFTWA